MREKREDELERFKREINLAEFAQSKGYEIVKGESSKASIVMRRGDDKIIVGTDENDGHGIYFSVRDDKDNGTIVDFVQKRQGANLGQVRKELRSWCPGSSSYYPPVAAERIKKPEPSSKNRQQVLAVWSQMQPQPANGHPYLLKERHIEAKTLSDSRFAGAVRMDGKGNAVFPHYDKEGICGYELKNTAFTGFANNGEKGLWISSNIGQAGRVVVVESAIDALSHAQLSKGKDDAYVSIGGQMSDKQKELLTGALTKAHQRGAQIVLATDKDKAGDALAAECAKLVPAGAELVRAMPKEGKDWNDQVKAEYDRAHSYDYGYGR